MVIGVEQRGVGASSHMGVQGRGSRRAGCVGQERVGRGEGAATTPTHYPAQL